MNKRKYPIFTLLLAAVLALVCAAVLPKNSASAADINATGINVTGGYSDKADSQAAPVGIVVRQDYRIQAQCVPANATIKKLRYELDGESPSNVIKLSKSGIVTGLAAGTATVKVIALGVTGTGGIKYITFSVTQIDVQSISLFKTAETVLIGDKIELVVLFTPANSSFKGLTYATSDPAVATVADGVITAVGGGFAVITVSSEQTGVGGAPITASFNVTVIKRPSAISVVPPDKRSYKTGETFDTAGMKVTAVYDDGSVSEVPLARVRIAGYSPNNAGEQIVNVIYEGKYDSFMVVVAEYHEENLGGCGAATASLGGVLALLGAAGLVFFRGKRKF